jgi:hypothetical protein
MDDTQKEKILDAENTLRDYMVSKRSDAEAVLTEEHWQGIMVTLALDVATSGVTQDEAISTLLALGWIAGRYHDESEFQTILQSFPTAKEIQEFWTDKVDEVMRNAQEELTRRTSEEA